MKGNFKKVIALLIALCLSGALLVGCNSKPESSQTTTNTVETTAAVTEAKPAEIIPVRYVSPGSESTDNVQRLEAINNKMKTDGVNLKLEFTYIGWDVWEQKINLMLSTNEEFDSMTIMEDMIKSSTYAGRGAIVPIDEYLDKYPDLKKAFPDYVWEGSKINGKTYSIPVFYREWSNDYEVLTARKDLLDKHNIKIPTNQQELIAAAEALQKAENNKKLYIAFKNNVMFNSIHREYATYPFTVVDDLLYLDQQGNVKAWMETDEFKKDCEFFNTLYTKGLIDPDRLTLALDQQSKPGTEGNYSFCIGRAIDGWTNKQKLVPGIQAEVFRLTPDKPWFRPLLMNNDNVVSKTSKHPEAVVEFFNWLYGSQDNFDILANGIKDVRWKDMGPGKMELIAPDPKEVNFSIWKIGYFKFMRYMPSDHPKLAELERPNDNAINAVNIGFTFNTEPVAVEYANLLAELKTSYYPLKVGAISYEKGNEQALAKMKAAGLDKVVAEYQSQLKAWLDSKKK